MHDIKFSVITVTYNAEKVLGCTLESIAGQTYPNIEHLIIDGASTDATVDMVLCASHKPIVASEPDLGLYDAMNKGIAKATGDYVWFINAGDTFYDNTTVEQVYEQIRQQALLPDIFYGNTLMVDEHGRSVGLRRLKAPEKLTWKSFKMGMLVCHQSFVVRREIAERYNLHYRYSADVDWCIRCMKKTTYIFNTHLILSRFLEGGISTVQRRRSLKERYQIMCDHYEPCSTLLRHIWFAIRFYFAKYVKGRV
jgi:glycosyltransferase involved in cell wall biosynthesis